MSYWRDKVVVITGGSSGLGLGFAQELSKRGAKLALVARDAVKLDGAVASLANPKNAIGLSADITNQQDVEALPDKVVEAFGKVDALINCAGRSGRGEVLSTSPEEFRQLWELNFLALVRCTQAFVPHLIPSRGHVVNIGSLASKSTSRFLGAYPASKFPVAAFSQQLRLEADSRLHVLLVCPGPIARADAGVRYENTDVPESAKKPGGGAKISQLDPNEVIRRTLLACERRKSELIIPGKARLLFVLSSLSSRLGDWLVRRFSA